MNRLAQGVILLLLGGAVLKASLGDIYLRYVKEALQPFLIGAGIMLVAAAVMTIVYELRQGGESHGDESHRDESHGDGHEHREPRVGWMLLAPVLGLLLVAPPALGAFAAGQNGSAQLQDANLYPPLPEGDPAQISMLDYATRAIFDKGESMKGRTVKLTGFMSDGPGGTQVLTRIMLTCCAADGRPLKIGLEGNRPEGVANDQWVEIVGRYSATSEKDPINGSEIPHIEVIDWRQVEPPRNQYE
jgi:uncharacterized repeat protein (TIGR03943 family)